MNTDMTTFPDYDSLRNNYLNMLSSNTQSNPSEGVNDLPPFVDEEQAYLEQVMDTSPLFSDLGDDFLTPMDTPLFDFSDTSPFTSPLDDYLTTPLFQDVDVDEANVRGDFDGLELFESVEEEAPAHEKAPPPPTTAVAEHPTLSLDELYTFSPTSPAMSSFQPSPYMGVDNSFRPQATGTRKGTTAETMIPLDAPTQPRHYRTPSATSRKPQPAAYSRKRPREEDEDLGELPAGATEEEQIAHKRRQNTIAARKSRKRKLEYTQALESQVDDLMLQIEQYKAKTEIYAGVLQSHGLVPPNVPP
jgi:hypothetical protein